jgi:hypothetical protein
MIATAVGHSTYSSGTGLYGAAGRLSSFVSALVQQQSQIQQSIKGAHEQAGQHSTHACSGEHSCGVVSIAAEIQTAEEQLMEMARGGSLQALLHVWDLRHSPSASLLRQNRPVRALQHSGSTLSGECDGHVHGAELQPEQATPMQAELPADAHEACDDVEIAEEPPAAENQLQRFPGVSLDTHTQRSINELLLQLDSHLQQEQQAQRRHLQQLMRQHQQQQQQQQTFPAQPKHLQQEQQQLHLQEAALLTQPDEFEPHQRRQLLQSIGFRSLLTPADSVNTPQHHYLLQSPGFPPSSATTAANGVKPHQGTHWPLLVSSSPTTSASYGVTINQGRHLLQSTSTSSNAGISTSAGNGTVLYVPFGSPPPFSLVPCPNSSVPTSAR